MCAQLPNSSMSDKVLLKSLFKAVTVYFNYTGKTKCLNLETEASSNLGDLGWSYQVSKYYVMHVHILSILILHYNALYKGKVKSSSLVYNQRETWNKRPLGRDPDRSWCHLHIGVKLFWSQPMAPWTLAAAYACTATQSMDPWTATKRSYHTHSVAVTPAHVRVPTQWPHVPSFTYVVG